MFDRAIKDLIAHKDLISCPEFLRLIWFYENYQELESLEKKIYKKYPLLSNYNSNYLKEYVYYINEKSKVSKKNE